MLGNLGMSEILMLLVICLVLFGAKRIPEIGSSVGKGIREFKHSISGIADEVSAPATTQARLSEVEPESRSSDESQPRRLL